MIAVDNDIRYCTLYTHTLTIHIMQASDWAEEAHAFYLSHLRSVLRGERHDIILFFGAFSMVGKGTAGTTHTDATIKTLHAKFRSDSILKTIDIRCWKVHDDENEDDDYNNPFALYEQIRGWQCLLRRIPDHLVPDARLLTLIRWNLLPDDDNKQQKQLSSKQHITIVSRKQWAVMEYMRWEEGVYQDPAVLRLIRDEMEAMETVEKPLSNSISQDHLKIVLTSDRGRSVIWQGPNSIVPGCVVWEQLPYVVAPYDIPATLQPELADANNQSNHTKNSTTTALACFHCARDLTHTTSNLVRDAALSCPKCHLVSYCSVACRHAHQYLHEQECELVPHVVAICFDNMGNDSPHDNVTTSAGNQTPVDPTLEFVAPFKALLVLRALLKADSHPDEWKALLDLESHASETQQRHPMYYASARALSQYMVHHLCTTVNMEQLFDKDASKESGLSQSYSIESKAVMIERRRGDLIQLLIQLFCAIHVNAIGLGVHAVGLFPGISSMFNHSCNENVTHSWDNSSVTSSENSNYSGGVGGIIRFRAVRFILPGEECCISYVFGLDLPTAQRIQPLVAYKFFTCTCPRCTSGTEQGRKQALQQWKHTTEAIAVSDLTANKAMKTTALAEVVTDSRVSSLQYISRLEQKCELADILFPPYHVQKGLAWEELALAFVAAAAQRDDRNLVEAACDALIRSREQYVVCRGDSSPLIRRVDSSLVALSSGNVEKEDDADNTGLHPEFDVSDQDDLCLHETGWARTIWEIKTWEPSSEQELESLAGQIRNHTATTTMSLVLKWAPGYRIWQVGYGILTLIMSCLILESEIALEEVASTLEDALADSIQNVDRIVHDSTRV